MQDVIQKWQEELLEEKNKKLDQLKKDIELEKVKKNAVEKQDKQPENV